MKKVLIITYYWPPSGGSGVQRWLKCVRYLRDYGWEPIVFTVENGEYPVLDESLEKEVPEGVQVIRRPIWEPYQLYKRFTGQKPKKRVVSGFIKDKKPSFTKRVSMWIRGNMFIPDARKFWIKPASRYLKSWLKENPVDVIVSTGPPHSMHLIAHRVTRKLNIPWLADFRDPWTGIPYYKDLKLTGWADRKHHRQEKMITVDADRFVVVGNHMKKEFEAIGGREVDVITNGYDEADLRPQLKSARDKDFTIVHIGFLAETQNHESLWQALGELAGEDDVFREKLRIRMIGKTDIGVEMYMKEYGIHDRAEFIDYVPHTEAIENQGRAQVLLLTINNVENAKAVITGKIFEYLAARRPILCIAPLDGDAADIVNSANAGRCADFHEKDKIKAHLRHFFDLYQQDQLEVNSAGVEQYSRRVLTGKFAAIFDEMVS